MIAKFVALVCLFSIVRASGLYGDYGGLSYASSIGYGLSGYPTYVAPSYTAPIVSKAVYSAPVVSKAVYSTPIVTKPVIPAYSYGAYSPALSTVSRYQVNSSPIVKSYAAPISAYSSYVSPYPVTYGHGYNTLGYGDAYTGYLGGYSGYGYGGHGAKYLW